MRAPFTIRLATLSLIILFSGFGYKEKGWIIGPDTKLVIHGKTNVTTFQCKMAHYNTIDTLSFYTDDDKCMVFFRENIMKIPVLSFDCGSNLINNDFYEALKKDRFPNVSIQFVALEQWTGNTEVGGTVYISLAGITKPFIIQYQIDSTPSLLLLKGRQKIHFSDFSLHPPEKMFGMIKVQDGLEVEFDLSLRAY